MWYRKAAYDEQVASVIYATNSPFCLDEDPEFEKLMSMLKPGYKPSSRKEIADNFYHQCQRKKMKQCKEVLKGETVSMALDSWSKLHNESIICVTVTNEEGKIYLTDTVNT